MSFLKGFQEVFRRTEYGLDRITRKIELSINKIKKRMFSILLQFILVALSFVLITIGAVLFFSRFFPTDIVLIVTGLLLLYIALLFKISR